MKNNTFNTGVPNFWFPPKLLLIMKLIIVIMTTFLLQASAGSFAQRITLNEKNTPIKNVLIKIRQQSGYDFIGDIKSSSPVQIQVNNLTLEEALNVLFANQDLTYLIQDKIVVIKKKSFFEKILKSFPNIDIKGKVLDETGRPLSSATITVKGKNKGALSNINGDFVLKGVSEDDIIQISYTGYITKEIGASKLKDGLTVTLELENKALEEVKVVSTGYQIIPKERATGSFEAVDNKLFNRSAGTDVFSRLDAITTGTLFMNKGNSTIVRRPYNGLIIRGRGSFRVNGPLIVLDNVPFEGDPNNINPNDVENITLLKDAAAASIWGSRAANGVIVITTKKGKLNQPFSVTLNTNITLTGKPDLFYLKPMNSSDFIDVERMLFGKGFYNAYLDPTQPFNAALSPVVELLNTQSALPPSDLQGRAAIDQQIDALRKYDVRNDILKYTYREGVKQQYALSVGGGDKKIAYLLSAGYDKNLDNFILTDYSRTTLRLNTTINPIKKLSIETSVFYTRNSEAQPSNASSIKVYGNYGSGGGRDLWPYSRLADDQGNPLVIDKFYRGGAIDTVGHGLLLDWKYRPLAEKNDVSSIIKSQEIIMNIGAKYVINSFLNAELRYQYQNSNGVQRDLFGIGSWWVRNMINQYTQYNNNKIIARPIPVGEELTLYDNHYNAQTWRGQLNFDKNWGQKHQLTVIAGAEMREDITQTDASRLYGYNSNTLAFQQVDYVSNFPLINGNYGVGSIEGIDPNSFSNLSNRYVSVFSNASYAYDKRYVTSLSVRQDAANFFGVAINKKWTPLWSSGFKWNISNEAFYKSELVPNLSLRMTYGKNGNVNNSIPAVATIYYLPGRVPTNLPYAGNNNPPNSELGMEKVGVLNLALDFGLKNNRLSGSLEYFDKRSKGVIAEASLDPSTGFRSQFYNSAEIHGKGVELQLNSHNLFLGNFEWGSNLLFTYNRPIVTLYDLKSTNNQYVQNSNGTANPAVGKDFYAVFAYPFAGLDHDTGDPKGYLNGKESTDYLAIMNATQPLSALRYFGSSLPLYYGAFRNNFSWNKLTLSVNISYRFAYFVHRDGIQYYNLFNIGGDNGNAEFANRWQKPGDELHTNVPSLNYDNPNNYSRDQFYRYSTDWVIKGDNIRLEDINLSYTFNRFGQYVKKIKVYANANNLGILWRANKMGIDPDYGVSGSIPPSRTFVFGLTAEF